MIFVFMLHGVKYFAALLREQFLMTYQMVFVPVAIDTPQFLSILLQYSTGKLDLLCLWALQNVTAIKSNLYSNKC
jgi:hypothetical protein